jgi:hypothetical protein
MPKLQDKQTSSRRRRIIGEALENSKGFNCVASSAHQRLIAASESLQPSAMGRTVAIAVA